MNHKQDIDDGLDEYLETTTRQQDEAAFLRHPALFSGDLGQIGDGAPFRCATVHSLHLLGSRRTDKHDPFSYEGGFASLEGRHNGGPVKVTVRWADSTTDITIEPIK